MLQSKKDELSTRRRFGFLFDAIPSSPSLQPKKESKQRRTNESRTTPHHSPPPPPRCCCYCSRPPRRKRSSSWSSSSSLRRGPCEEGKLRRSISFWLLPQQRVLWAWLVLRREGEGWKRRRRRERGGLDREVGERQFLLLSV